MPGLHNCAKLGVGFENWVWPGMALPHQPRLEKGLDTSRNALVQLNNLIVAGTAGDGVGNLPNPTWAMPKAAGFLTGRSRPLLGVPPCLFRPLRNP